MQTVDDILLDLPETSAPDERPVQARSRRTQEKLLGAATNLLVERGYGGWRFADVAEQAGVSLGALTHHYPDKATLLIVLTKAICQRATVAGVAAAREASETEDVMHDLMATLRDAYFTPDYDALREIGNAVHSNKAIFPKIEPYLAAYRTRINDEWLATFTGLGFPADRAATVIAIAVNMVRGMAAHSVWRPDRGASDAVIAAWKEIGQRYLDGDAVSLPADDMPADQAGNDTNLGRKK